MKRFITTLILSLLILLSTSFAAQNFTVSTNNLLDTIETSQSSSSIFSIENTGNSELSLNITTTPAGTINLNSNVSTIQIEAGTTKFVNISYSSSSNEGTFTGEVIVFENGNTSNNETISLEIEVEAPGSPEPELTFVDEDNTLRISGETGENTFKTFILKNTGDFDLQDITFSIEDLEGDSDDISDNDIWFNSDDESEFEIDILEVDEEIEITIEIEISSNIESDTYDGEFTLEADYSGGNYEKDFELEVDVNSNEEDISFENSDPIRVFGEAGDTSEEFEFIIENQGDNDVNNLELRVEDDLQEKNSNEEIPLENIVFEYETFNIRDNDDRAIEFEIEIPDNQPQGTYVTEVQVVNANGDELDSITLELRVTGDIYIQEITFPEEATPGDNVEIEIDLRNQGTTLYRDVKIDAYIFDVDSARTDLDESTSTFLMNSGDETTKVLRFNIPEDALDGTKTLEIKLSYDNSEISEIETIDIVRPSYNVEITSHNINPRVAVCVETLYTFIDVKNLGKYDERIKISATIQGTSIRSESNLFDINVDEAVQQTLTLPIDTLEPGTYTVVQTVSGQKVTSEESMLRIDRCGGTGGIDVDTNTSTGGSGNSDSDSQEETVSFFGQEIERTTAILSTALAGIALLIVVSLFFL